MRGVAGPGQVFRTIEHGHLRCRAAVRDHKIGQCAVAGPRITSGLRDQETAKIIGLSHRCRESDAGEVGREAKQPCQAKRQEITAFGSHQRMQLIEHHAL